MFKSITSSSTSLPVAAAADSHCSSDTSKWEKEAAEWVKLVSGSQDVIDRMRLAKADELFTVKMSSCCTADKFYISDNIQWPPTRPDIKAVRFDIDFSHGGDRINVHLSDHIDHCLLSSSASNQKGVSITGRGLKTFEASHMPYDFELFSDQRLDVFKDSSRYGFFSSTNGNINFSARKLVMDCNYLRNESCRSFPSNIDEVTIYTRNQSHEWTLDNRIKKLSIEIGDTFFPAYWLPRSLVQTSVEDLTVHKVRDEETRWDISSTELPSTLKQLKLVGVSAPNLGEDPRVLKFGSRAQLRKYELTEAVQARSATRFNEASNTS